jgi:hypothetical protein
VVILDRRSISPDANNGNLDLLVVEIKFTRLESENIAAATALHMSTSKPIQILSESISANPTRISEIPQFNDPLFLTSSSVKAIIGKDKR